MFINKFDLQASSRGRKLQETFCFDKVLAVVVATRLGLAAAVTQSGTARSNDKLRKQNGRRFGYAV